MLNGVLLEPPAIDPEPGNDDIPPPPDDSPFGIPPALFDNPPGNMDCDIRPLLNGPVFMEDDLVPCPFMPKLPPAMFPEVKGPGPYIMVLSLKAENNLFLKY
jgi:hypothetical protein